MRKLALGAAAALAALAAMVPSASAALVDGVFDTTTTDAPPYYTGNTTFTLKSAVARLHAPSGEEGQCDDASGTGSIATNDPITGGIGALDFLNSPFADPPGDPFCWTNLVGAPGATVDLNLAWDITAQADNITDTSNGSNRDGVMTVTGDNNGKVIGSFDLFDENGDPVGRCVYSAPSMTADVYNPDNGDEVVFDGDTMTLDLDEEPSPYPACTETADLEAEFTLRGSGGQNIYLEEAP
jgi:hypothetical protein